MSEARNPITRLFARPNEDPAKIFGIAVLVAMSCAILVSTASIMLEPYQEAHLKAEREARMAAMLQRLPGMEDVLAETGADSMVTRLVDLSTGQFVDGIDPETYDAVAAATNPESAVQIPPEQDIAGLRRRAPFAPVHLLESGRDVRLVVLPIRGTGYQSTIEALLALEADLNTVAALTITQQGDTPGLGAGIEEPEWQALWPGRQIADERGAIRILVVRGEATGPYEVDGISGASRTGAGVTNMLRYWLGDHGFGPFLDTLRAGGL